MLLPFTSLHELFSISMLETLFIPNSRKKFSLYLLVSTSAFMVLASSVPILRMFNPSLNVYNFFCFFLIEFDLYEFLS